MPDTGGAPLLSLVNALSGRRGQRAHVVNLAECVDVVGAVIARSGCGGAPSLTTRDHNLWMTGYGYGCVFTWIDTI